MWLCDSLCQTGYVSVSAMRVNHMLLCCIYSRCNIQRCVSKQLR